MEFLLPINIIKTLLPILAIIAGIFVITTKNPIISVFNLIVLYILVAFYLIYIGLMYLGISYIVVYIGAIAILFLFVIMMIDVEVVEKRTNNYLPLLFLLLGGFLYTLKNNFYNLGLIKMKSLSFKGEYLYYNNDNNYGQLFDIINDDLKENVESDFNKKVIDINSNFVDSQKVDSQNIIINDYNGIPYEKILNNYDNNYGLNNLEILMLNSLDKELFFNKSTNVNIKPELEINDLLMDTVNNEGYIRYNILNSNLWEINSTSSLINEESDNSYLFVTTDWSSALNKITQVSAIGDVLYTLYHSYIYVLSVILLLGLIGAIILTADSFQEIKNININKTNNIIIIIDILIISLNYLFVHFKWISKVNLFKLSINISKMIERFIFKNEVIKNKLSIPIFFESLTYNNWHSEIISGNLIYFIVTSVVLAILLLFINSYFSLNIKYLDKGGGFECGFTSFIQTRERFNIIFYRVSLLFLVFDLEIILIYPYPAIFQKNQNISKNNVLIFIYILVIGFIYELKEGALNIVKKGRPTEISNIK